MTFRRTSAIASALVMIVAADAGAGHAISDGTEQRLFDKGGYSVIIARVEKVWVAKSTDPVDDRDNDMVLLVPLATLAGTFDASLNPEATFQFFSNQPSSSIEAPPKKGQFILAVIRDQVLIHEDPKPHNVIVSDTCTFVPGGSALTVLKGMNDAVILETVERLKKARAIAKKDEEEEKVALERLEKARAIKKKREEEEKIPREKKP